MQTVDTPVAETSARLFAALSGVVSLVSATAALL